MNSNRPRRCLSIIGMSLLVVAGAACGSDSKSDSTVAVTTVASTVASTDVSAAATTTAPTAGGTATTDATQTTDDNSLDSVPAATSSDDRKAIVEYLGNIADAGGFELDEQCVTDIVAKLSDADAALLADSARAGGAGDPELSAEGEAVGNEIEKCATAPTTTAA